MAETGAGEGFTDLTEFRKIGSRQVRSEDNVIKSVQVVQKGVQEVLHGADDHTSPEIVVHREGDTVIAIDFLCKCGHSATVRFEYDEE